MRQFYQMSKIRDTLRPELTWSHYRRLISVENEQARIGYMNEVADSVWSTRQMIGKLRTNHTLIADGRNAHLKRARCSSRPSDRKMAM